MIPLVQNNACETDKFKFHRHYAHASGLYLAVFELVLPTVPVSERLYDQE